MPVLYTTLEETQKTILKSCFFSIIKDVVRGVGIPHDVIVAMHNGVEVNKTDNRTNATIKGVDNLPATVSQRRVIATIVENYDEDSLSSTTVSQSDVYPIFIDHDIDVCVYPVYVKSQVTIEIEYSCGSKTEAMRVRDDIRVKMSQSRNIFHHEVDYNIILPSEVEEFIGDVYDLKNRLFPKPIVEYFLENSTKRIHRITDMANEENSRIAVHERQVRIVGVMDFPADPPPIEQNAETNTYKLTIPYKFTVDVPRGMCMKYPVMICNRLMPAKYLEFIIARKVKTREEYGRNMSATDSIRSLTFFESDRQFVDKVKLELPLNIPMFDEFHKRVGHKGYVITTTFLTDVDETDKRTLLNLRELGDFCMDDLFLNCLVGGERNHVINPYMSPFYLGLHQTSRHHDNNILEVDANLNVKSKKDISFVKPTRVALSVCLDVTSLNDAVIDRLKLDKEFYLLYLSELIRGIINYKPEFASFGVSDNTFYRHFIVMLNDAINKEQNEFIKKFFIIFSQDALMFQTLIGLLRNNYANMYAKILKIVNIDKYKYNDTYMSQATGIENYVMRTVMSMSVSAYKMPDDRRIF